MNNELSILVLKDRIDFITQQLSKDEFTASEYEDDNDLSKSEFRYRNMMIEMCREIADQYEYLLDEEFVEDEAE